MNTAACQAIKFMAHVTDENLKEFREQNRWNTPSGIYRAAMENEIVLREAWKKKENWMKGLTYDGH